MLELRLAVLVTFFDTVVSHRGAELLQCIVIQDRVRYHGVIWSATPPQQALDSCIRVVNS